MKTNIITGSHLYLHYDFHYIVLFFPLPESWHVVGFRQDQAKQKNKKNEVNISTSGNHFRSMSSIFPEERAKAFNSSRV